MSKIMYEGEPALLEGTDYKFLIIDPREKSVKILGLDQIKDYVKDERFAKDMVNFIISHEKDWKYITEFHPNESLSRYGGRESFHILDGDYRARLTNVADRIMIYLNEHLRLTGEYDNEMITTFIVSTYFMDLFDYAPRLFIRGGTDSGKSNVLKICKELCYRGNMSGDTTEAALFRMIDLYKVTPLIDEFQDYDIVAQKAIKKILKGGVDRDHPIQRAEKIDTGPMLPRTYEVFAPLIFVTQAGGREIPEEVVNRSLQITMLRSEDISIPVSQDLKELEEIRNELYTIKLLWMADSERVGFGKEYQTTLCELQSPDGIDCDGTPVRFRSRERQIVSVMYTIAKLCRNESAVLNYFKERSGQAKEEEQDSECGRVFNALLNVLGEQEELELFKGCEYELLVKVTTHSIAKEYERMLINDGELGPYASVQTRVVTNILKDMGFKVTRAAQNKSVISRSGLRNVFKDNLFRFGSPEHITRYGAGLLGEQVSKSNNTVNPMCQTQAKVNKVTTTGGL